MFSYVASMLMSNIIVITEFIDYYILRYGKDHYPTTPRKSA